jgi:hypothetical protein
LPENSGDICCKKVCYSKLIVGVHMKKFISIILLGVFVIGCAPAIGSEEWCKDMKEKPKGDWTATEAKDYTKHCIFPK